MDMKNKRIELYRTDKKIAMVMAIHLLLSAIKNMLSSTLSSTFPVSGPLNIIVLIILFLCYSYLILKTSFVRRIPRVTWIVIVIIASFFLISHLCDSNLFVSNEDNYFYVSRQFNLFVAYSLPLFVAASAVRKPYFVFKYLKKYAFV